MGLRFRKSIKVAPGVKINLGKKSAGVSLGGKYGGVSFNTKSGARARVSAPGTGLSYSTKIGSSGGSGSSNSRSTSGGRNKNNGSCLLVCLKVFGYLMLFSLLLVFGWIAGIVWLLFFRKKMAEEPEKQKKHTVIISILSALSFLFMIYSMTAPSEEDSTVPSSTEAVIGTEIDTENTTEYEQNSVSSTESELPNEDVFTTEATDSSEAENDIISNTEMSIDTEQETEVEPETETETTSEISQVQEAQPQAQENVQEPAQEPVQEPAQEPIQPPVQESQSDELVWIDDTAQRYHKKNGCGMDNAYQVTLEEALAKGKTPCGRCYR